MKPTSIIFLVLLGMGFLKAQTDPQNAKFYIGASFGTSFSLGDFKDTDIGNPDAGFADNGTKFDLYGGFYLNDRVTLTGTLRYQTFDADIGGLVQQFSEENPGISFSGSTGNWDVYSLLIGIAYKVNISKKFSVFPRFGMGPMIVNNPGISVSSPDVAITENFNRSSESGFGINFEIGIGLKTNLGKHFALMPAFTYSGGIATIKDVVATTDNITATGDFDARIQSFNLGISIAYRFY
ncbi:MAG: outer membrane beta-barrel protein [Bacteroidota bacterium]